MKYELKNCRDGSEAVYTTTVDITEKNDILTFVFEAENSKYYCAYSGYNKIHSKGDACEILIGSDPRRKVYYEIEISPSNDLMIAEMTNHGVNENGDPILTKNFVKESFISSSVEQRNGGYTATLTFDKGKVMSGKGEMYFNAYRLETDGGESEKHLFAMIPTMRPRFHVPKHFVFLKDYVN